jgi:hypothetical protein
MLCVCCLLSLIVVGDWLNIENGMNFLFFSLSLSGIWGFCLIS